MTSTILKLPQVTFVHLKGKVFAEYDIIYHINDGNSIKELSEVCIKHQLLFQKFSNKIQQLNLMLFDGDFPIILPDVALTTLIINISSFKEYLQLKRGFNTSDIMSDEAYLNFKVQSLIRSLLFTNIASRKVCNGEILPYKVYYLKNSLGTIDYYSIYDQGRLLELMIEKMQLKINLRRSFVLKKDVHLRFQLLI